MISKLISRSIEESRPLVIIYQKPEELTQRVISPISILGGKLRAWDHFRQAPRTFIIDHILSAAFWEFRLQDAHVQKSIRSTAHP